MYWAILDEEQKLQHKPSMSMKELRKNSLTRHCQCSRCKLSGIMSKDQPVLHIYQSYLDFAKECLVYQDMVHKKQTLNSQAYLNQILNFDRDKLDRRTLDLIFEDYIKNYSRYVLKDSFDLGVKKSYYAIHKKVEYVLKQRHILQDSNDDNLNKLIEAYKLEKNRMFIEAKQKSKQSKPFRQRQHNPLPASLSKDQCKTYLTQVPSARHSLPVKDIKYKTFGGGSFKTQPNEQQPQETSQGSFHRTFMELKKRNLWRSMHISRMKKIDGRRGRVKDIR